jgi:hypothetical protein
MINAPFFVPTNTRVAPIAASNLVIRFRSSAGYLM